MKDCTALPRGGRSFVPSCTGRGSFCWSFLFPSLDSKGSVMLVYRLEHRNDGKGPFQSDIIRRNRNYPMEVEESYKNWRAFDISSDGHCPPDLDRYITEHPIFQYGLWWAEYRPTLFCGTISAEQFEFWFPRSRWNMFHELGMVLKIFQAEEHVFVGRSQVLFAKQTATLVEQKSLL